jgi:hypothetical protein
VFSTGNLCIADKDVLLLELFKVYRRHWPEPLELDNFIRWGQMMLSDFDEIDKYCVDAGKLFMVIRDEKEIEARFSMDEDLQEWLSEFWGQINEEKDFEKNFLMTWKILAEVYTDFKRTLKEKGLAYEGMLCEEVLNEIQNGSIKLPYQEIHFIGFNAFSTFEERLIETLALQYHVSLHWDTDEYYLNNDFHEAGKFLRKYRKMFTAATHYWDIGDNLHAGRKFHFHAAPLAQGQANVAATLIDEPFEGTTAVVVCDDSLQEPILHAVSCSNAINFTMGKKIGDSPLSELLFILFRFSVSARVNRKDAERLSLHPYLHLLLGDNGAVQWTEWLRQFPGFYIPLEEIANHSGDLGACIQIAGTFSDITRLWLKALEIIQFNLNKNETLLHALTTAYIHVIQEQEKRLSPYLEEIGILSTYQLFRAALRSNSLPYDTFEDVNIQVMGFLETRLIDFDRVIIVGANEDILPAGKWGSSYIPYNLRKIFGLPTLQEYDGVYAYHFFRLLQRSKEAHFVYNSVQGDTPFQKSRFLEQVLLELNTPENQLREYQWNYECKNPTLEKSIVIIPKTKEHIDSLKERYYSQTSLSLYLTCPVQFYLQYIEKINEPDSFEENLDAGQFGSILHKAIEFLYADLKGIELTEDILLSKKKSVDQCLKSAFEVEGFHYDALSGENLLACDIIREAIYKLIALDAQLLKQQAFRIHSLEGNFERTLYSEKNGEVHFRGKIDRLDEVITTDGEIMYRVLDYKTGKVDLGNKNVMDETVIRSLFERMQTKQQNKLFQGIFYLFLLNQPSSIAGFYSLRKLSEGMLMVNQGKTIPSSVMRIFEEELIKLVDELLDNDIPFARNEAPEAYQYSPFQFVAPY